MPSRILVVSPHLDDAALGCCDHLLHWQKSGCEIRVLTVFTSFESPVVSDYQRRFMRLGKIDSVQQLRQCRVAEDTAAMQRLGVAWEHLGLVDAGFRVHNGQLIYPDYRQLCGGCPVPQDAPIEETLTASLRSYADFDIALAPLTVGHHVDHVVARRAVEATFEPTRRQYYVDYPYAMNPTQWSRAQFATWLRARKSIRWTSAAKQAILDCYPSQMPWLFRRKPRWFPEMILTLVSPTE